MLIISGPSGAGKSTISNLILESVPNCYYSVSTTTRVKRDNEVQGREYNFVSKDEFLRDIESNNFLEYEMVHSNYYGTSRKDVENAIKDNKFILFDIDVRGHNSIKKVFPDAKSIFITAKNKNILKDRLLNRGLDSYDIISQRVGNALFELKNANSFDYIVVNEDISKTKEAVLNIIDTFKFLNNNERLTNLVHNFS